MIVLLKWNSQPRSSFGQNSGHQVSNAPKYKNHGILARTWVDQVNVRQDGRERRRSNCNQVAGRGIPRADANVERNLIDAERRRTVRLQLRDKTEVSPAANAAALTQDPTPLTAIRATPLPKSARFVPVTRNPK